MSQRVRGQEATLRVAVDGVVQQGSMFKVKDFTFTPRQDIVETDYCGEDETDLDFQHHGWDLAWSVDMMDATTIALLEKIVAAELAHEAHPKIVVTVIYTFREGAAAGGGRVLSYHTNLVLKQGDENGGGRKEYVSVKYEAKCKKRSVLVAA
jgi:hypothetical protein